MLVTPIPAAPHRTRPIRRQAGKWWQDFLFGWKYLYQRSRLFRLLLYYASVNFFLNFATVLRPMVLSTSSAGNLASCR
jgi:hypothetical protein